MDFDRILNQPWEALGHQVAYQPCAQQPPYDSTPGASTQGWNLKLPGLEWTERHQVLIQCFDFLTITDTGCRELEAIERHYGDRADRVTVIHWEVGLEQYYSGPVNLIYFPSHSYQFLYYVGLTQDQWQREFTRSRYHNWQCLNGRVCDHRAQVCQYLRDQPNGLLSLGDEIPLSDWPYSTYRGTENQDNWIRLLPVYSSCDVNIITETIYDNPLGIITEKTLMAFLARQVPIVIGYPGIVDHCESLGFDMFRDIVDTSYDRLPNDQRLSAALHRNQYLLDHGIDRQYLSERLEKNYQWVRSGWPKRLVQDYQRRVSEIAGCLARP